MEEQKPKKQVGTNKSAETILDVLGSVGSIAGPLIFGPDFQADLGAPFKTAGAAARNARVSRGLRDVLNSHPETAAIVQEGEALGAMGGFPGALQRPDIRQYLQNPKTIGKIMNVDAGVGSQIMGSIAAQKPTDPNSQILNALKIRDYETPEQKRTFDTNAKIIVQNNSASNGAVAQKNRQDLKEGAITPTETKDLYDLQIPLDQLTGLKAVVTKPDFVNNFVSTDKFGRRIVQENSPQFALFRKEVSTFLNDYLTSKGGKALTQTEIDQYLNSLFTAGDEPSFLKAAIQNTYADQQAKVYTRLQGIEGRGGNVQEMFGDDVQGLNNYKIFKQYKKDLKAKGTTDPDVMRAAAHLGLNKEGLAYTPDQIQKEVTKYKKGPIDTITSAMGFK